MKKNTTPSRAEVEKLKKSWLSDPIWDIEETEGFEAYHDELKLFQEEQRAIWNARDWERRKQDAATIGVDPNSKLYDLLKQYETRIAQLESMMSEANDQIHKLKNLIHPL